VRDGDWKRRITSVINLAWDHNSHYHERLLRALPARCGRVLDVGCGAGEFAARLAERADQVDALDRSPAMIAGAWRTVPVNVTCVLGDAATAGLPGGAYGAVTSISALHHVDLPAVLPRLAAALRPGGPLIAVSRHRLEIPRGLPAEAVSVLGSNARRVVLLCLPAGRRCRREMYRRHAVRPPMLVLNPELPRRRPCRDPGCGGWSTGGTSSPGAGRTGDHGRPGREGPARLPRGDLGGRAGVVRRAP
jgi:SAM-dependent methyltransferase